MDDREHSMLKKSTVGIILAISTRYSWSCARWRCRSDLQLLRGCRTYRQAFASSVTLWRVASSCPQRIELFFPEIPTNVEKKSKESFWSLSLYRVYR
jgi:hypothetical protein